MLLKHLKYITLIVALQGMCMFPGVSVAQNSIINLKKSTPPRPPHKQPSKEVLARSYYYSGDYEKAAQLYGELYKEHNKYLYYSYYYNSLVYLKRYKEAERATKKQIKLSPENYRYKIDMAYIYSQEGQEKKANRIINRILNNLPDNRNMIINIANNLQSRGFTAEAIEVYETAKKRNIGQYSYSMEMARSYQYAGDYDKMLDLLIEHLNENPGDLPRVENRIQNMLVMDVDNNLSKVFKEKILIKAQTEPDNAIYAELLMWYSLQVKDFDLAYRQAKSIERRYKDQEEVMLEVGDIAYSNKRYDVAVKAYEYLMKKKDKTPYYTESSEGYFKSKVKLAEENPETEIKTWEELAATGDKILDETGINRGSAEIVQYLARVKAYRLGQSGDAITLLNKAVNLPLPSNEKAQLKMELANILAFSGKFWDASLLYSQVEHAMKNDPLGHEAKFRNARIFYYKGEFEWAKTRLDVLKGATSKFIANDAMELSMFIKEMLEEDTLGFTLRLFAAADQYAYQQKYDSALLFLNKVKEQTTNSPAIEYVLFDEAAIYKKLKQYQTADSLYTLLYTSFPNNYKADNALFESAEINRNFLNKPSVAAELYLKLMKDYPESIYATEARKIYRKLNKQKNNDGTT